MRKALLLCGIVSSLVYLGRDLGAWFAYPHYDFANQVISELSAIGAPSRDVDVAIGRIYGVLLMLFSAGIAFSAGTRRGLTVTAVLLAASSLFGAFWPPMHMRGAPATMTDTLHIVWTGVWLVATLAAMWFAAASLGKRFALFTIACVVLMLLFGAFTGVQGVHLAANQPTPGIGIFERVQIGAYLVWIAALSLTLWPHTERNGPKRRAARASSAAA